MNIKNWLLSKQSRVLQKYTELTECSELLCVQWHLQQDSHTARFSHVKPYRLLQPISELGEVWENELPSLGIVVVTNPETEWGRWHDPQTWHSRSPPRSCWAWLSRGQTCWQGRGRRTRCTACGSWLWRVHRSTAFPRSRSARKETSDWACEQLERKLHLYLFSGVIDCCLWKSSLVMYSLCLRRGIPSKLTVR